MRWPWKLFVSEKRWTEDGVERLVEGYSDFLLRAGRWNAGDVDMYRANMRWALLGVGHDPMMQLGKTGGGPRS